MKLPNIILHHFYWKRKRDNHGASYDIILPVLLFGHRMVCDECTTRPCCEWWSGLKWGIKLGNEDPCSLSKACHTKRGPKSTYSEDHRNSFRYSNTRMQEQGCWQVSGSFTAFAPLLSLRLDRYLSLGAPLSFNCQVVAKDRWWLLVIWDQDHRWLSHINSYHIIPFHTAIQYHKICMCVCSRLWYTDYFHLNKYFGI